MNSKTLATLEAWVDVGGTFTDCYVRDAHDKLTRMKTLSSGKVRVSIAHSSSPGLQASTNQLDSPELLHDPAEFWTGSQVKLFSIDGQELAVATVLGSGAGELRLGPVEADLGLCHRAELDPGVEAPVLAIHRLLGIPIQQPLPPLRVRLGTTKGTNALLTRSGARTAMATTAPFEDLLAIGDQTRPNLFQLAVERPAPLAELILGIDERLDAQGQVLLALDERQARQQLERAHQQGCSSLAICLLHAYVNPIHEQRLVELACEVGFRQISCSSQLAPLIEIVARAQTTVVDAYLSPIVRDYMERLVTQLGGADRVQLSVMTSAGGLVAWQNYYGKDSILSGPAGGVAALRGLAATQATSQGRPQVALIGLDMGGTSTDVCRVANEHSLQYESTKAGVRILTPTLPIETIASGGGSICWFDGVSLRVGPQSAGAAPGPACYGRGGPLTITDLNLFLGRIPESQFPFPLDRAAVAERLHELLEPLHRVLGFENVTEIANGYRRIANEQMAAAVRSVSISQGVDPRQHALVGFGGAAGQHICEIAEALGITHIIDSPEAGMLSALGMGMADRRLDAVVSVYQPLAEIDWGQLDISATEQEQQLSRQLREQGESAAAIRYLRWLELRYVNTEATLTLPWSAAIQPTARLQVDFATAYRLRYGYVPEANAAIELVAARIEVLAASPAGMPQVCHSSSSTTAIAHTTASSSPSPLSQSEFEARLWCRDELTMDQRVLGPAVVLNVGSTLVVEAGWEATRTADGLLHLEHCAAADSENSQLDHPPAADSTFQDFDPVFRECFAQRLSAIATQMGIVLQQTAVSVNVKRRRDYSCAIFDVNGKLLANAPHVPVHLGAMGETVRAILADFPTPRKGESFITNDPYRGGSHLPDVTVVTPVFGQPSDSRPRFFVANRAHHADIGGIAPGSMSVRAVHLGAEGVIITPMRLETERSDCLADLRRRLQAAPFPPRNIQENLADISAQLAANARGVELLAEYAVGTSWEQLQQYAKHVLDAAEERVRNFLSVNFRGLCRFVDHLDDGTPICVAMENLSGGRIRIDFTGSGPTSPANFNANPSIVTAAVIYVLRCWIADELPLNEGVMRCVDLIVPEGVLNPTAAIDPAASPAVAAGNVETSQRVVDVLLGALQAAAASQGTMNNLLFGNSHFGFYETICGGAGATPGKAGVGGVHTHMTNTRLTDPEVLEARYPVRLRRFGLRRGSGGAGQWHGGDGVVRAIEFLEPVELSLLTSRRGPYAPFGLQGGQPGALGSNTLVKLDGSRQLLPNCCQLTVAAGEQIEIQTPGGGGYGPLHSATMRNED